MPWWAWLLVDLFLVLAALSVVVIVGFGFYRRGRAFLRMIGDLDIPKVERPLP